MIGQGNEAGGLAWSIADHQRSRELWLLGAAFALAVIAFGRRRGLSALAGLGVTFAILLFFIVPAILDGRSPMAVAVVGSAEIMLTVLYLTHGFAYAGASLPLMLLFATGGTPVGELLTGPLIAQELVRSAVGTIGLIAAVPITTALAALVAHRTATPSAKGGNPAAVPAAGRRQAPESPWAAFEK